MLPNINSNITILEKVVENYLEISTSKKLGLLALICIHFVKKDLKKAFLPKYIICLHQNDCWCISFLYCRILIFLIISFQ